jgi:hypothetical protein
MHFALAKLLPRLLTDDQKLHQFSICENLFQRANDDKTVWEKVITDVMWVYDYEAETQKHSLTP